MDISIHAVACVGSGEIHENRAGGYQRQILITTDRGERLTLMLFSDRQEDLAVRGMAGKYPAIA